MSQRVTVHKTWKLFVGGGFPRSESGRSYVVEDADGGFRANAARASRKDVRDAVTAARGALASWSAATAYNRGQILYRVAEMMEGRREQFAAEIAAAEGLDTDTATATVDAAIDRWVWYAGWSDKYAQVAGAANPVAGPYFNLSVPEPMGVVGVVATQQASLLGLVAVVAPVVVAGNSVVVIASQQRPLPAVLLGEVLATSDVPGGVVNVLTGLTDELAPVLSGHLGVDALDLTGLAGTDTTAVEQNASENIKRFLPAPSSEPDFHEPPYGPRRILAFCETKTVWHPKGL